MQYWEILGIDETDDKKAVKRAYSKKLKVTRPDDDPVAYQELREAYDWIIKYGVHYVADASAEAEQDQQEVDTDEFDYEGNEYDQGYWSEQQLSEVETPLQDMPSHYQLAHNAVTELFSLDDEGAMIDLFQAWLVDGEISNLKVRESFSDLCFQRALDGSGTTSYRYRLFQHMASEFEWLSTLHTDYYRSANQDSLQIRFDAYSQYLKLHDYLDSPWYTEMMTIDYWVAKLLLGPLRPILFFMMARIGALNYSIAAEIKNFQMARNYQIIPEIETPSLLWWEHHLGTPRLSLWHLIYGNVVAFAATLERIDSGDGTVSWLFYTSFMIAGAVAVWALMLAYSKISQVVVPVRPGLYQSYFWYVLMVALMCVLIFLDNDMAIFLIGLAFAFTVWKLIGSSGIFNMVAIVVITGWVAEEIGMSKQDGWYQLPLLLAISCYFALNLMLPYLPRSWSVLASRSGIPYIVATSVMTAIILVAVETLKRQII